MVMKSDSPSSTSGLQIISPVFRDGAQIPEQYTCRGQNVNPPLNFFNVPRNAQSLALIMHDPDAPVGDYTHWLVWDMPTDTETIAANSVPVGAVQGANDSGEARYMGPCPPAATGTHRYMFELYALNKTLGLASGSSRDELTAAMQSHVLAEAKLTGVVAAPA